VVTAACQLDTTSLTLPLSASVVMTHWCCLLSDALSLLKTTFETVTFEAVARVFKAASLCAESLVDIVVVLGKGEVWWMSGEHPVRSS